MLLNATRCTCGAYKSMLKLYVPRFVVRAIIVSFLEFQNSLPRSSTGRPLHPHLTILLYALLLLLTLCVADVTISPTPPRWKPTNQAPSAVPTRPHTTHGLPRTQRRPRLHLYGVARHRHHFHLRPHHWRAVIPVFLLHRPLGRRGHAVRGKRL